MFKKLRAKKRLFLTMAAVSLLMVLMSVSVFATDGTSTVDTVITDLSTVVTGLLTQGEAVFGFITSGVVLPWVLLGVGVSLISVCIWWAKWIMWGK